MKKLIVIIGMLALLANFLFGVLISIYDNFNVGLNSGVIVINAILLYLTVAMKLKDGYKVSLSGLFGFMAIVEFVICLFSPARIGDNIHLIVVITLLMVESVILMVAKYVSNNLKRND